MILRDRERDCVCVNGGSPIHHLADISLSWCVSFGKKNVGGNEVLGEAEQKELIGVPDVGDDTVL